MMQLIQQILLNQLEPAALEMHPVCEIEPPDDKLMQANMIDFCAHHVQGGLLDRRFSFVLW